MGDWTAKLVQFVLNQPPHILANDGYSARLLADFLQHRSGSRGH